MMYQKDNIEDIYPLSDIERGMVFAYLKDIKHAIYHNHSIYVLEKSLFNFDRFKEALKLIVHRHDILRIGFNIYDYEEPIQLLYREVPIKINLFNVENQDKGIDDFLRSEIESDKNHPFDLKKGELLWRLKLYEFKDNIYILWIYHHAILDGWSSKLLNYEIYTTLNALSENIDYKPIKLKLSYKDCIIDEILEKQKKDNIEYWNNELFQYKRYNIDYIPHKIDNSGDIMNIIDFKYDDNLLIELNQVSKKLNSSVKNICFAAFCYTLFILSKEDDFVVGMVTNNRPIKDDSDKILGCFLNTIPVNITFNQHKTWNEYITYINRKLLELKKHERISLFEITRIVGENSRESNPFFDLLFNFMDFSNVTPRQNGSNVKTPFFPVHFTNTFLDFEVFVTHGEFILRIKYHVENVNRKFAEKISKYFQLIVGKIIHETDNLIEKNNILPEKERLTILQHFNETKTNYSNSYSLFDLFNKQVSQLPDNIALIKGNNCLSYKELNRNANQLAYLLRSLGVQPNTFVGVIIDRSLEMIIALMGIIQSGGAYCPIEPSIPVIRIQKILKSVSAKIIVTNNQNIENVSKIVEELNKDFILICLNEETGTLITYFNNRQSLHQVPDVIINEKLKNKNKPDDYAYVIFTSGSTGEPKGVVVKHRPVINLIEWVNKTFHININDKLLFVTSYAFDLSVYDIFGILASGASIEIASENEIKTPTRILELIANKQITFWDSAPAALQQIIPYLEETKLYKQKNRLRLVFLSGDWIPLTMPEILKEYFTDVRVIGLGGATEATIWSNYYPINEIENFWKSVPYGKPIQNAKYYILNKDLTICPIGVSGDLYIGGECLATGYLNDSKLTSDRFIQNSYCHNELIYKTGDTARWFEDGNMEFLGRTDFQVKIRGFRIELGEIESAILKHKSISDAVVLVKGKTSFDKYICAYYTTNSTISKVEIKNYVSNILPVYMVPTHFIELEKMPLTTSGKVDRKQLPETEENDIDSFIAPRTEIEKKLVNIWADMLNIKNNKISINDDFFAIGGNSLSATHLLSKISKEFNVKISLKDLFSSSSINNLAILIKNANKIDYNIIKRAQNKQLYDLSSAQKQMYFLQMLEIKSTAYNFFQIYPLKKKFDEKKLEVALQKLINRHESLRTSFIIENGIPKQKIHKELTPPILHFKINENEITECVQNFKQSFNLSEIPLWRVGLLDIEEKMSILLVDMHHIISDDLSRDVFFKDLIDIYENRIIDDLPIQYKDYSEWYLEELETGKLKEQERFWTSKFDTEIPLLNLPFDFQRNQHSFDGDISRFVFTKEESRDIHEFARQHGVTPYMFFLAVYSILLSKISNENQVVIGTPIEGRRHPDLLKLIGVFINTLPFLIDIVSNARFEDFLTSIKDNTLEYLENQDYNYHDLVKSIYQDRKLNRNPLFDTMFMLVQEIEQGLSTDEWLDINYLSNITKTYKSTTSRLDITLFIAINKEEISGGFEYKTKLFKKDTISKYINFYKNIIANVLNKPEQRICEIDYISSVEKRKILLDFNSTIWDISTNKSISELFQLQAEKAPDNIAIMDGDVKLTYAELNEKSYFLANHLFERGVNKNSIVGVFLERSIDSIISVFAIMKTGAAYLPMDIKTPANRVKYIILDSNLELLITNHKHIDNKVINVNALFIEDITYTKNSKKFEREVNLTDIAYVIYTSGSTGQPKGVMIEHLSIINGLSWMQRHYTMTKDDVIGHKTSIAFDISIWELFWWCFTGASVCIISENKEKDPASIIEIIDANKVTILQFVPSVLNLFLQFLQESHLKKVSSLKQVYSIGEAISIQVVERFNDLLEANNNTKLTNIYGPTEATVHVSSFDCTSKEYEVIPIGKPIDNTKLIIVNNDLNLNPIGTPGELYIAGVALARGYLNNPELTYSSFIKNPYELNSRIYKTGDNAKWDEDGNIIFLGRNDCQVKIAGNRIELGEIEKTLLKISEIENVVIIVKEDQNKSKYLCAYFISPFKDLELSEIKRKLSEYLPNYMIPKYFVQMDKFPINKNGKLDKKLLPDVINEESKIEYIASKSKLENLIYEEWKTVLGKEKIGIHDNFFEIGGDSLKIMHLSNILCKKIDPDLSVLVLFENPTIKKISDYLIKKESVEKDNNFTELHKEKGNRYKKIRR